MSYTKHPNKYIGAHVSAAGGVEEAPLRAGELGARAFAFFLKNQRQWQAKPYTKEQIDAFIANCDQVGIRREHILPHASYLYNIGNADAAKRLRSRQAMIDEMHRCEQLGLSLLNFHPGSHLKEISEEQCMEYIAAEMNAVLAESEGVKLVLENVAGQGTNVAIPSSSSLTSSRTLTMLAVWASASTRRTRWRLAMRYVRLMATRLCGKLSTTSSVTTSSVLSI